MSDYTDITDYYSLLAMQNPGKAVYHPPAQPPSPAAEAVLNAVTLKRWDVPYQACGQSLEQIQDDAATVLRAAALHLRAEEKEIRDGCSYSLMIELDDLLSLADELESL